MSGRDLARTLAFAFKRKGADAMPGRDLRMLLAYDLRWFAPEDAKRAVHRGIETGLLVEEGELVRPAFDLSAVDIPLNFRPSTHVLDEEVEALPRAPRAAPPPAPAVAPAAPGPPSVDDAIERAAEEERRRRGLRLSLEAARLVVRRRAGEDVVEAAAALEARLLSAGGRAPPAAP